MRAIASALAVATLACPALAQRPALTLQVPCAPEALAFAQLRAGGYVAVAKGRDSDGDPFALYRRGDGAWRAIALVDGPTGGRFACALIGGDGLSVGDLGDPA